MEISNKNIDNGKPFDWGRTSQDYARYRDIYPEEFYRKLTDRGLCVKGQRVLDIGTGTGVLPRNMYKYGAEWTAADISPHQIEQAKRLAEQAGMDISFVVSPAEELCFDDGYFDVMTACQCFWYFDHEKLMPKLKKMLKSGGRLAVMSMSWLPFEDRIAGESERMVLRYSPDWTGAGYTRKQLPPDDAVLRHFKLIDSECFDLMVHFTRESWHGRMKACRGVGASLDSEALAGWEREHKAMLEDIAPEEFDVLHYAEIIILSNS